MKFCDDAFLLKEKLKMGEPIMAGKIGINELRAIHNYFNNQEPTVLNNEKFSVFDIEDNGIQFENKLKNLGNFDADVKWNKDVFERIYLNNGIFPEGAFYIFNFLKEIIDSIRQSDALANWSIARLRKFEKQLILNLSPSCELVESRSLEPYYSGTPWTEELKNKKVLIVSPFVKSIKNQYEKRSFLWQDPRILPDFELITLHHQLNPNLGVPSKYRNWVEMLQDIKNQISNIDFDTALIGTGASSLPIAAHCKKLGKQAIHLGGSLQILFGINGKRWEEKPIIKSFQNRHWTKVLPEETPLKFKENESGCYW
jgi:hypothetical protein